MACVVTREFLVSLLQAWKEDKINANDVMTTTSLVFGDTIALDWEDNEGLSVTMEVLDLLESLDINLITKDDIDAYIKFLHTPIGEYEKGAKKLWQEHEIKINREERKKQLKNVEPYSKIYGK